MYEPLDQIKNRLESEGLDVQSVKRTISGRVGGPKQAEITVQMRVPSDYKAEPETPKPFHVIIALAYLFAWFFSAKVLAALAIGVASIFSIPLADSPLTGLFLILILVAWLLWPRWKFWDRP